MTNLDFADQYAYLARLLRHDAINSMYRVYPNGAVPINQIVGRCRDLYGSGWIDLPIIISLTNQSGEFDICVLDGETCVRATSGHSYPVTIACVPSDVMFHAIPRADLNDVRENGVLGGVVHPSPMAAPVSPTDCLLVLDTRRMFESGVAFYSNDGTESLTANIPSRYIVGVITDTRKLNELNCD